MECENIRLLRERSLVLSLPSMLLGKRRGSASKGPEAQTLQDCLDAHAAGEMLQADNKYACCVCRTQTEARRRCYLAAETPQVMALHLKGDAPAAAPPYACHGGSGKPHLRERAPVGVRGHTRVPEQINFEPWCARGQPSAENSRAAQASHVASQVGRGFGGYGVRCRVEGLRFRVGASCESGRARKTAQQGQALRTSSRTTRGTRVRATWHSSAQHRGFVSGGRGRRGVAEGLVIAVSEKRDHISSSRCFCLPPATANPQRWRRVWNLRERTRRNTYLYEWTKRNTRE